MLHVTILLFRINKPKEKRKKWSKKEKEKGDFAKHIIGKTKGVFLNSING